MDPPEQTVLTPGKNEPSYLNKQVLRLGKSHLTSMVTSDIHGSVRLDLVTGPPENVDDDEIQCLGKMLLDSLEPNPCSSPCWTTPLLPF